MTEIRNRITELWTLLFDNTQNLILNGMFATMFTGMNGEEEAVLTLLGWLRTHRVVDYAAAGANNHTIAQELRTALRNYGNAVADDNAKFHIAQATNLLNNVL